MTWPSGPQGERESQIELLADEFRRRNVVVLCGAGISCAAPASLPLGDDIKKPFLQLIRDAIAQVDRQFHSGVGPEFGFPDRALPKMPERLLAAFHQVFDDDLFTFLDPMYEASTKPNHNHRYFAQLARAGFLTDIVTLNFDLAIETALETYGQNSLVFTTPPPPDVYRAPDSPLRLHKLHGTLRGHANDAPSIKYQSIKYTVQRIGTSLDESLVDWLRGVIAGRSLLVTGYSGGDLDVLPALQGAVGAGDVFWNSRHEPVGVTDEWLRRIGPRCHRLPGDIADVLDDLMMSLNLGLEPRASAGPEFHVSLQHLERNVEDALGVLLAAAAICHETELREHAGLRDSLVATLYREDVRQKLDQDPRKALLLRLLSAGPQHERGNIQNALGRYYETRRFIAEARRRGVRLPDRAAIQLEVNVAYNEAWFLKRFRAAPLGDKADLVTAARGAVKLIWWTAWPPGGDLAWRSHAAHHLAETPLTWGLVADVCAPGNMIAWALYLLARFFFRVSSRAGRLSATHDAFRMMRLAEVEMNIARTSPLRSGVRSAVLTVVDRTLEHCRYLNGRPDMWRRNEAGMMENGTGAMDGDAAAGVHLILEALREHLRARPQAVRLRLQQAWEIFAAARYGSGWYRTQMYAWILCSQISWRDAVAAASTRLRRAIRLRTWFSAGGDEGAARTEPTLDCGGDP